MTILKRFVWMPAVSVLMFSATALAGAPPPFTVHSASINLKLDGQDLPGDKIFNDKIDTKVLINLLLGNPIDVKVDKNEKLVVVVPCNPDGALTPMYITVWDTSSGYVPGANWLEFDGDFTLVEVNKDDTLKKSSAYVWQSDGGVFGEFEEVQGAFSATYKQLPKQFDNPSVCVNGLKSSSFTGEIINDVEFGGDWVITGGKLSASKPIDVIAVFPPVL